MRNRKVQRKIKNLIEEGVPRENIRVIHEEKLKLRSEIITNGEPAKDPTPWKAIKPETRLVVKC